MQDARPVVDTTEGVETFVEALSVGAGKSTLIDYLRNHETTAFLIDLVARETGIRPVLVRLAYSLLVRLIVNRADAVARRWSQRLGRATAGVLARLPYFDKIASALATLEGRLRDEAELRSRLEALLSGSLKARAFGDAAALSDEARLGLHILEEAEAAWAEADQQFDALLSRSNPRPPLTTRALSEAAAALPGSHLRFNARRLPFIGRDTEFAALDGFLGAERRFSWWLLVGAGGSGKSRMALELCLRHGTGWRAGFLRREASYDAWERWQPEAPTLIVIDYAVNQVDRVRRIITTLRDREAELDAPVRLLLLERSAEGDWWQSLVSPDATGAEIRDSCHDPSAEALRLGPLADDEIWSILQALSTGAAGADREQVLPQLLRIDPARRPLFIAMAGDALCAGRSLQGWQQEQLLEDVLARERARMWPEDTSAGEANLLALATMCGPLPLQEAEAMVEQAGLPEGFLPDFDPDAAVPFENDRYVRLAGRALEVGDDDGLALPPLEPDLIGEFFVLRHLSGPGGRILKKRVQRMRSLLWWAPKQRVIAFAEFLARCADDFIAEPALWALFEKPNERENASDDPERWQQARRSWTRAAYGMTTQLSQAGQLDEARRLLGEITVEAADPDTRFAHVLAASTTSLMHGVFAAQGPTALDDLIELEGNLRNLEDNEPDNPLLFNIVLEGASLLFQASVDSGLLDDAIVQHELLTERLRRRPENGASWLYLARASETIIGGLLLAGRTEEALSRLEPLIAEADRTYLLAGDPDLHGVDPISVTTHLTGRVIDSFIAAGRGKEAERLLDRAVALVTRHGSDEAAGSIAYGFVQLIMAHIAGGKFDRAVEFRDRLEGFIERQNGKSELRLARSAAAGELVAAAVAAGRTGEAGPLFDSILELATSHPDDLLIRISALQRGEALRSALEEAGEWRQLESLTERLIASAQQEPSLVSLRRAECQQLHDIIADRFLISIKDEVLKRIGEIRPGSGALLKETPRQLDERLSSAQRVFRLMYEFVNIAIVLPASAAGRYPIVGPSAAEEDMQVMLAHAASKLIHALVDHGRPDEASAVGQLAREALLQPEFRTLFLSERNEEAYANLIEYTQKPETSSTDR